MKIWAVVAIAAVVVGCLLAPAQPLVSDSPLPTPTARVYEDWELVFQCMSDCTGAEEERLACYAECREKFESVETQSEYVLYLPMIGNQ